MMYCMIQRRSDLKVWTGKSSSSEDSWVEYRRGRVPPVLFYDTPSAMALITNGGLLGAFECRVVYPDADGLLDMVWR
jgi:hypothetical protein